MRINTPAPLLPGFCTRDRRLILHYSLSYETQADIKVVKRWALRNGWTITRTYKDESIKRAFTLKLGPWSITGLNRVTLPMSRTNPYGHRRDDDSILCYCNLTAFYNDTNISQYGNTWRDVLRGGVAVPLALIAT